MTESEVREAVSYLEMYRYYSKCRALEIPLTARDLDAFSLNIIYTIHTKLDEMDRMAGSSAGGS